MTEVTRKEHLEWCKKRALDLIDAGDCQQAFASFSCDVKRHPETANISETIITIWLLMLLMGVLKSPQEMRAHIMGYN